MPPQKKPRTPQAPRRVQAPRTRGPHKGGGDRNKLVLYGIAAVGAIAIVAVVLFLVLGGGSKDKSTQVAPLMTAAGCSYRNVTAFVPKGQGVHVNSLTKKFPWNTDPPSNGQHYPLWAVWGFYTDAVNPRQVVHNEEHGGIVTWFGSGVPQSTVSQLHDFYNEQPDGSFGTLYPKLGTKIAITAWTGDPARYGSNNYFGEGHIAICPRYDAATKKAFEAFRNAYRGKGPEGIPLSLDEPGMGPQ